MKWTRYFRLQYTLHHYHVFTSDSDNDNSNEHDVDLELQGTNADQTFQPQRTPKHVAQGINC